MREHGIYLINKVRAELIVVVLNQLCLFPLYSSSSRSLKKKSPNVKAPTVAKKRKREDANVEGILLSVQFIQPEVSLLSYCLVIKGSTTIPPTAPFRYQSCNNFNITFEERKDRIKNFRRIMNFKYRCFFPSKDFWS